MSKVIVTHVAPDFDALASSWLIRKYMPGWAEANMQFVPAGTTLEGKTVDSDPDVIHVDTGLGRFDHHQIEDNTLSATKVVFETIEKDGYVPVKDSAALSRIVDFVSLIDNFKEAYFHEPTSDIYDFSLYQIIEGLKGVMQNDPELAEFTFKMLDATLINFKNKIRAEEDLRKGLVFQSKYGKSLAIENKNDMVIKLALKSGFDLVIRQDQFGFLRIKTFPRDGLDLTTLHTKLKDLDPNATWFLHSSKKMLLNGSSKNPTSVASKLTLQKVIEIVQKID